MPSAAIPSARTSSPVYAGSSEGMSGKPRARQSGSAHLVADPRPGAHLRPGQLLRPQAHEPLHVVSINRRFLSIRHLRSAPTLRARDPDERSHLSNNTPASGLDERNRHRRSLLWRLSAMTKQKSARGRSARSEVVRSESGAKLCGMAASAARAGAAGVPVDGRSLRHITGRDLRDTRSRGRGERRPHAGGVSASGSACGRSASRASACRCGHRARMISPVRHPSTLRWNADAILRMGTGMRPGLKSPNCS
jgi:hypothetical protein